MKKYFGKECKIVFVIGTFIGAGFFAFSKTKKARELAVKGVAGGMMLKDKILESAANLKEEADDICAEAKLVAKANCDCADGTCKTKKEFE